jgi:hypothetical protein
LASERQHPDDAADVDRGRGGAIGRRVVAELAEHVGAPALEERAGRNNVRARVRASEREQPDGAADVDRGRGVASNIRAVAELDDEGIGHSKIKIRPVAELAEGVEAPALEERAGRHVRARVLASERQHPDDAADVDRGRGSARSIRAVAELAEQVGAPALEERAGREVRARVHASERQQPDGAADVDRGRGGASNIRVVAELA